MNIEVRSLSLFLGFVVNVASTLGCHLTFNAIRVDFDL